MGSSVRYVNNNIQDYCFYSLENEQLFHVDYAEWKEGAMDAIQLRIDSEFDVDERVAHFMKKIDL